jgi:hypothetical protein
MIYSAKSVFLAVNVSLRWFINVGGVYLVRVSLILIGPQQGLGHFFRCHPCIPLAKGLCEFYAKR